MWPNNGVQSGSENDEDQTFLFGTVTETMAPSNAIAERTKEPQNLIWIREGDRGNICWKKLFLKLQDWMVDCV